MLMAKNSIKPSFFYRGTTIGGALNEALKLLRTSGPDDLRDGGGQILILTDGSETEEKNQKKIKGRFR